jgi:glycosyltransferase involved in cell wall biosynthesis
MYFGLPIVAYASTAVPETLGKGGILVHEKRFEEIAALVANLAKNQELRDRLKQEGTARVKELSLERFAEQALRTFVAKRRETSQQTGQFSSVAP